MTDASVTAECEECVGALVAMGAFEVVMNGETYGMDDSELFFDLNATEPGFVHYEGQEADYYSVTQRYEDGQKVVMVVCETESAA